MKSVLNSFVILVALLVIGCGGTKKESKTTPQTSLSVATIEDGEDLISQKEYKEAAEVFKNILKNDANNAKAHYYLGYCSEKLENSDDALLHYRLALKADPNLMDAHNNLGLLLLNSGDLEEARVHLEKVIDSAPDDADAQFNFAMLLERQGKTDKAIEKYMEVTKLNSEDPAPWMALADIEKHKGHAKKAFEYYQKATDVAPDDPLAAVAKAQQLLKMKKNDDAVAIIFSFSRFKDADELYITIADRLLTKIKKDKEAIELYKAAIAKDPDFPKAHILMANALARTGNFKDAILHFKKFLELDPDSPFAAAAQKGIEVSTAKLSK
jgi:tetratricopeptide (TPR) repeat protein